MDKYEFNIKVEQIKKLVNKGDYETAMKIADGIDWRRVRSTSLLTMVAQVYERNEEYQDAKDILLLAFERAPIGKGLLFKLTDLALREGNIPEAEAYYREFCDLSADDPRQNLLRYLILEAKGAPLEQLIHSLECYCQEELDEKWLYKLAELYQEAGREEDCVKICDKIMLMFGLGKYVDKAMELKIQYAPLTNYQMDLVENREKYEEKLRAVEQQFNGKTRRRPEEEDFDDADDAEDSDVNDGADDEENEIGSSLEDELVVKMHEAEAEEDLAKEMSRFEPYDEEEVSPDEETRVLGDIRNIKQLRPDEYAEEEAAATTAAPVAAATTAASVATAVATTMAAATATAAAATTAAATTAAATTVAAAETATAAAAAPAPSASAPSAQAESAAAVSEPAKADTEEDEETVVEDWDLDLEAEEEPKNHLMIEAEDPASGLKLALDSLKKLHKELNSKNPVAKISGENLNKKGVFAVSDRLAGKDLIIERAADLNAVTVTELSELMEQDNTGMIVVLIDTPVRMERLHNSNTGLADKFQYIGCDKTEDAVPESGNAAEAAEKERREVGVKLQDEREAEAAGKRTAEVEAERRRQAEREAEAARAREERAAQERAAKERELREREAEERRQAEYEAEHAAKIEAERAADEARRQAEYEDAQYRSRYENGEEPEEPEREERRPEDDKEMDVEEFVQYACKYAADIDCSISGKSMLALYERAEMMEEDGIPLTQANAEDLMEEAADKAEKKSFGGLFSSKYDKDGLLILKEKHFFD